MCNDPADDDVRAAMPHPVALEPVDEVVVTTLVDNVYDALLTGGDTITRAPFAAGTAQAPQFEPGRTNVGLMAEHGFSALITVRRGDTTTSVLFDTGLSPDAMVTNAGRLGLDLSGVHAVVLSHGHFDHAYYTAVKDRKNSKRAALSEARKIICRASHILAELGDDALATA